MKRINNRGVVLLETLIVSVFVMTIFIFVYRNIVPMLGNYEKLETFDDVDSVYAANLVKNMVITNISSQYIDNNLLNTANYADISDCNDRNLYVDAGYCNKLKQNLHIEDTDIIYITKYSAKALDTFREDVNKNSKFSGGELGKFQDYLKSVANNESFYNPGAENNKVAGLYRVFISRSVPMLDGSTIKKFANIGIYKNNYNDDTITIFGREYAVISNEPTLTTSSNNTNDDAGLYKSIATNDGRPTYYFRGNVDNNYVRFANNSWRIVRINEDGTIRIIRDTGNVSRFNQTTGGINNAYFSNAADIRGYLTNMYGYEINYLGFSDKVATGNYFCEQYKVNTSNYSSYTPSFRCLSDENGKGLVNSSTGVLSYDEVVFAGGYYNKANPNYYLNNGTDFWIMTPNASPTYSFSWYVGSDGSLSSKMVVEEIQVRPVLNLKSTVTATGTGTKTDPFVIQ